MELFYSLGREIDGLKSTVVSCLKCFPPRYHLPSLKSVLANRSLAPIAETDEEEGGEEEDGNEEKLVNMDKSSKIVICGHSQAMDLAAHGILQLNLMQKN